MREIKFRAWDGGQMFQVEHLSLIDGGVNGLHLLWKSLMQYTGLQDSEGNDLYESDIIHHKDEGYFEITYADEWGGWAVALYENVIDQETGAVDDKRFEVPLSDFLKNAEFKNVGNIYENPELLQP